MALEFVYLLAFMDMSYYHSYDNGRFDIYIMPYYPTNIIIHLPWDDVITKSMTSEKLKLWYDLTADQNAAALARGIRVETSAPVTVQVSIGKTLNTLEVAYLALPLSAHSTEFYMASYTSKTDNYKQMYIIAAGEQAANVTITGDDNVTSLSIEAWTTTHMVMANSKDITGYHVVSTSPISVFSGHQCANIPNNVLYCDPLLQQIPPVASLGTEHVVGPIIGRSAEVGYTTRIVLIHPETDVTLVHAQSSDAIMTSYHGTHGAQCPVRQTSGTTTVMEHGYCSRTQNSGDFIEVRVKTATEPMFVQCSASCMVVKYNHGGRMDESKSDPFMMMVLPLWEQEEGSVEFTTFSLMSNNIRFEHENYVNIATSGADLNLLLLDGVPVDTYHDRKLNTSSGLINVVVMKALPESHIITTTERASKFCIQFYGHGNSRVNFNGQSAFGMPINKGNRYINPDITTAMPTSTTALQTTTRVTQATMTTIPPTIPTTNKTTPLPTTYPKTTITQPTIATTKTTQLPTTYPKTTITQPAIATTKTTQLQTTTPTKITQLSTTPTKSTILSTTTPTKTTPLSITAHRKTTSLQSNIAAVVTQASLHTQSLNVATKSAVVDKFVTSSDDIKPYLQIGNIAMSRELFLAFIVIIVISVVLLNLVFLLIWISVRRRKKLRNLPEPPPMYFTNRTKNAYDGITSRPTVRFGPSQSTPQQLPTYNETTCSLKNQPKLNGDASDYLMPTNASEYAEIDQNDRNLLLDISDDYLHTELEHNDAAEHKYESI